MTLIKQKGKFTKVWRAPTEAPTFLGVGGVGSTSLPITWTNSQSIHSTDIFFRVKNVGSYLGIMEI